MNFDHKLGHAIFTVLMAGGSAALQILVLLHEIIDNQKKLLEKQ